MGDRTDAQFEQMFREATEAGERALLTEPRAVAARYDRDIGKLVVELHNGVVLQLPPDRLQGLAGASPDDLSQVQIEGAGFGLHWERLDADLSVVGLAQGIFGTRAWMSELARAAGSRTSVAKAVAARENGRLGGRPKKVTYVARNTGSYQHVSSNAGRVLAIAKCARKPAGGKMAAAKKAAAKKIAAPKRKVVARPKS
jgi:hypothetical protein